LHCSNRCSSSGTYLKHSALGMRQLNAYTKLDAVLLVLARIGQIGGGDRHCHS
jgi:hypothetical protein